MENSKKNSLLINNEFHERNKLNFFSILFEIILYFFSIAIFSK